MTCNIVCLINSLFIGSAPIIYIKLISTIDLYKKPFIEYDIIKTKSNKDKRKFNIACGSNKIKKTLFNTHYFKN